jgi:hypothetical protein
VKALLSWLFCLEDSWERRFVERQRQFNSGMAMRDGISSGRRWEDVPIFEIKDSDLIMACTGGKELWRKGGKRWMNLKS